MYCFSKQEHYFFQSIDHNILKEKLELNPKTRIYKCTDNYSFLGRNKKQIYIRYRNIKRKIKAKKYLYNIGFIGQVDIGKQ